MLEEKEPVHDSVPESVGVLCYPKQHADVQPSNSEVALLQTVRTERIGGLEGLRDSPVKESFEECEGGDVVVGVEEIRRVSLRHVVTDRVDGQSSNVSNERAASCSILAVEEDDLVGGAHFISSVGGGEHADGVLVGLGGSRAELPYVPDFLTGDGFGLGVEVLFALWGGGIFTDGGARGVDQVSVYQETKTRSSKDGEENGDSGQFRNDGVESKKGNNDELKSGLDG